MAWPIKLRAMSFAIPFAVVLMECVLWALPIGVGLWWWGLASPRPLVTRIGLISIAISLLISGQAHVRAPRYVAGARRRAA